MIRSIDKIDDVKMEYSLQITFRYIIVSVIQIIENSFFMVLVDKTPHTILSSTWFLFKLDFKIISFVLDETL